MRIEKQKTFPDLLSFFSFGLMSFSLAIHILYANEEKNSKIVGEKGLWYYYIRIIDQVLVTKLTGKHVVRIYQDGIMKHVFNYKSVQFQGGHVYQTVVVCGLSFEKGL